MKIRVYLIISLFFLLSLPIDAAVAQTQNDFDSDGISDLTTLSGSTDMTWTTIASDDESEIATTFGLVSDMPALTAWESEGVPVLGIVRIRETKLVWKILQSDIFVSEITFGKLGDVALSGADFDGNGVADAAVVTNSSGGMTWHVRSNMFTDSPPQAKRFKLGKNGDRVFYINPDGVRDVAAVFGATGRKSARLTTYDVKKGKTKRYNNWKRFLADEPRPRPFPIAMEDGNDAVGFVIQDETDTTILVYTLRGRKIIKRTLQGTGEYFVGEYLPDESGEEICLDTGDKLLFYNPFSDEYVEDETSGETPVDEINVLQLGDAAE